MVGKLKYIVVALTFCLMPNIVHADCSYERTAELSRIASNVQLSYTYEIGENVIFNVTLTNLTNDIYAEDENGNIVNGAGERTISYEPGQDVSFTFYSNDQNCYGEELLTQYITLPSFNKFSNYAGCSQHPEFKYCQLWSNTDSISSEQFYKELRSYANNDNATIDDGDVEKTSIWDAIKTVVSENLVMVIMSVIAIGILALIIILKKIRKTR